MVGGEGIQANQAGSDRCSGQRWQIGGWGWVRGSDRVRVGEEKVSRGGWVIMLGEMGLGFFFFKKLIYVGAF